MPCRTDPDESAAYAREEMDKLTRIACDAVNILYKNGLMQRCNEETIKWFEKHLEWDTRRQKQEKEEKEAKALAKKALAKLSPAERKALGV